jgi:hypothetical protein
VEVTQGHDVVDKVFSRARKTLDVVAEICSSVVMQERSGFDNFSFGHSSASSGCVDQRGNDDRDGRARLVVNVDGAGAIGEILSAVQSCTWRRM